MRIIDNELPTKGLEDRTGTMATLKAILAQHPEHPQFDFQVKAHEVRKIFYDQKDNQSIFINDEIYQWVVSKLQTANYQGIIAGKLIESFSNAKISPEYEEFAIDVS